MRRFWAAGLAAVLVLTGCASTGAGGGGSASPSATGTASRVSGTVKVLYAGSLAHIMETDLGPDFAQTSGARYVGEAAGSVKLAQQIKAGAERADVFISANTQTNDLLRGAANGDWVRWYAVFGSAPLVLGVNPKSAFAHDLTPGTWAETVRRPGFHLGSTDPQLDPKGQFATQAMTAAGAPADTAEHYPEQDLVGRLQAGQMDAAFFYSSEAKELGIPTIGLGKGTDGTPIALGATYTVTVLRDAPNPAGAEAFVRYLLSGRGPARLRAQGVTVPSPTFVGDGVPAGLR